MLYHSCICVQRVCVLCLYVDVFVHSCVGFRGQPWVSVFLFQSVNRVGLVHRCVLQRSTSFRESPISTGIADVHYQLSVGSGHLHFTHWTTNLFI